MKELIVKEAQELSQKATVYASIGSKEQYEEAGLFLQKVKQFRKGLDERRKEITRPLDDKKQEVMVFFAAPISTLEEAAKRVSKVMLSYSQAVEAEIREAERKRIEAEREAERKQIEALNEKDKAISEAVDNAGEVTDETQGKVFDSEAAADKAVEKAQAIYVPPPAKVKGTRKTKRYSAKVTDKLLLIKVVAEGKGMWGLEYLEVNEKAINSHARIVKEAFQLPGCELLIVENIE